MQGQVPGNAPDELFEQRGQLRHRENLTPTLAGPRDQCGDVIEFHPCNAGWEARGAFLARAGLESTAPDCPGGVCRASRQAGQSSPFRKGGSCRLSCLSKSLLVGHSTMRTGRSYSPRTLVSNTAWIAMMPSRRRHVAQRGM